MDAIDFAFLGHPASLDHVADLLPRVRPGLDAARARSHKALLAKAFEWSPPVAVDDDLTLTRPDGQTLHGRLIICTFLPEHAHSPRQLSAAYQKTRGAAALARDLGARLVGLGGFTSIVGGALEEKLPRELGIAATSGNSLTAALALEQIRSLLSALDWELSSRTVAILGATGDIGQACARGLIETLGARRLRLIARNRFKLESLKATLAAPGLDLQTGADPADAIGADLILAATSTAAPLLDEARLPAGTIVCDIGYPATIAYGAAPRADVLAFSGGLARTRQPLPLSPYTLLPDPALLHGCFAETLALVMAGRYESYSLGQGRITLARMEAILDLARAHGFEPAPIYRGPAPLDTAGLDAFARTARRAS